MELEEEGPALTALLAGKVVKLARRHRVREVVIELTDGTRLFVDHTAEGVECSVTGPNSN